MADNVIVSKEPAAVAFIARHLSTETVEYVPILYPEAQVAAARAAAELRQQGLEVPAHVSRASRVSAVLQPYPAGPDSGVTQEETDRMPGIPVFSGDVKATDIRGKVVYGNLPMHLASQATEVHAIEFADAPPRGQEDMIRLECYVVLKGTAAQYQAEVEALRRR